MRMANGARWKRYLAVLASGSVLWGLGLEALAQGGLLSRYHRDQSSPRVVVDQLEVSGRVVDGKLHLSEREAVEMALRQNLDINVERHGPLFESWNIESDRAAYDPVGLFNFNWDRETIPTTSVLQGGEAVTDVLTVFNYGYRQGFSTGTTLEIGFVGSRSRTTNFFASLVPAFNTRLEIQLRQNLLQGFGKAPAEYQLEISRNNLEVSREEFRRSTVEVVLQVQDVYRELQFAIRDIEVREKSQQLAETVLEHNRARFEFGTAARLEVVQAEAELALRREEVIRARFEFRRVHDQLIRLMTSLEDPRAFPWEIHPVDPVGVEPASTVEEPFDALLEQAIGARPEIRQVDLDLESRRVELDLSRDRLRPSLELVAGYQQFGLGGTEVVRDFSEGFVGAPVIDIIPGGLGDSFSRLFSGDFAGYLVGLNLQVPVFNREARARNAQARVSLNRTEMARLGLRQRIALELRDVLTRIESDRAGLEASEAAVRFAQERLQGEQARFEVGMGTTRDLIEAQRDLLQAETLSLRARIDLVKNYNLLDRVLGRTFERQGIRLADALRQNVR